MQVKSIKSAVELQQHVPAWLDLANHASEDNVFYEHWMLIPAVQHLAQSEDVEVLFVWQGDLLYGVVPIQKKSRYRQLPLKHYTNWLHKHCYLGTPLIRASKEMETIGAIYDWIRSQPDNPQLMIWQWLGDNGHVAKGMASASKARKWIHSSLSFPRATFVRKVDPEAHIEQVMSGRHRREFGRIEKRLAEKGELTYVELALDGPIDQWINDFLDLEASGWKGKAGTALKCIPGDQAFFREVMKYAFEHQKLSMISSRLGGKAITFKCDFYAKSSAFSFKITYDEEHSKHSPGFLLHLWQIREILRDLKVDFIDSCAEPGHTMIDRIWTDRRIISTRTVSMGRLPGTWLVRLEPKVRRLYHRLKDAKKKKP